MRILWINHRDPKHPHAGGAEVRLYEIGRRLAAMGHSVTLLSEKVRGLPREEQLDGIRIKRLGGKTTLHLKAPLYVKKHGHKYDAIIDDIAHAVPWYSPRFTKTPVLAQVHHVHQDVLYEELPKPLAWAIAQAEKTIAKTYNHIIAVSHSTKQELTEKLGIPPHKITIIPNGIDTNKYKPGPKHPRPTIVWVGRIKKYKNLHHLLKAYQQVKQQIPDAQLIIIGTGDQEPHMKQLAKKLQLKDTHFLGKVPEQEKIKWMQKAWLIVSTSTKEGWGMTILEAASCKTPAIAYNVPGLRDAVKHNKTGILINPGNIIDLANNLILLIKDNTLRKKLAHSSFLYANKLNWSSIVNVFIKKIEFIKSN